VNEVKPSQEFPPTITRHWQAATNAVQGLKANFLQLLVYGFKEMLLEPICI
jgi:hypothetical protein